MNVSPRPRLEESRLSVVLPLFNEAGALERLYESLTKVLSDLGCRYELLFVNDGSTDGSGFILDALAARDATVRVLHLSRNFGHQAALHAGLTKARGDAVIVMDSDLQDDPAALANFVREWQAGADVVYARRTDRKEGPLKRALFHAFYRLLKLASQTPLPNDAGNFGLIDRRVADLLASLHERDRYFPGLRSWVGFRQAGVPVARQARYDHSPRVSWRGLVRLAKSAFFSFSTAPLVVFHSIAAASLLLCGGLIAYTLWHKCVTGLAIPGWTSLVGVASFFGAVNALGIGILGEYVVRIYDQVRGRPPFLIARETSYSPAQCETNVAEERLLAELTALAADAARDATAPAPVAV